MAPALPNTQGYFKFKVNALTCKGSVYKVHCAAQELAINFRGQAEVTVKGTREWTVQIWTEFVAGAAGILAYSRPFLSNP